MRIVVPASTNVDHAGSEVHVLDQGDGAGLSSYAATYPKMVASVMSALRETTGVDVPAILAGEADSAGSAPTPASRRL